jgi:PhnB protein
MNVEPYLYFNGRCEEALNFYREALGAEIVCMMRFHESPDPTMYQPEMKDKIMHSSFRIGDSTLMASDGMCQGTLSFQGISLTINAPDANRAEELFKALGDGGQVQMPLTETFFSPKFGMVADRFGVSWMIIVSP